MFHRVKSESQQESNEQDSPQEAAENNQNAPQQEADGPSKADQNQLDLTEDKADSSKDAQGSPGADTAESQAQTQTSTSAAGSRPGTYKGPSYPSAYPASPPSSKSSGAAKGESTDISNDKKLTIGTGITMSGEIEACDHLYVQGTVEAALKGAKVLNIAETGVFYGTVEIEQADVAGRFEGEITVNGRLTIRSSGVISGSISYKELEVEAGAVIDGRLTPISFSQGVQNDPNEEVSKGSAKGKASKKSGGTKSHEPANSDEASLFAENVSAAE